MKKIFKTLITATMVTTALHATDEPILGTVISKHLATAQDHERPRSPSPTPTPTTWSELETALNGSQYYFSCPTSVSLFVTNLKMIEEVNGGAGQGGAKAALIFQQQMSFIANNWVTSDFATLWDCAFNSSPSLLRYPVIYQFIYNRYQSPTVKSSEKSEGRCGCECSCQIM